MTHTSNPVSCDWQPMQLRYVSRFAYGDALAADIREDGPVVVYGSNGAVGTHSKPNTKAPCIIVGRKGSFGKVSFSSSAAFVIDTAFFVDSTQTRHDLRWLFYVLSSLGLDDISQDTGVPGLSRENAYSRRLVVPPLPQQRAIAVFLDRKTAAIDGVIAKKQRMVELLNEKEQSLITQVVTKGMVGLLRDGTGNEKWMETRVGRVLTLQRGFDITGAGENEGTYPVVSSGGFSGFSDTPMVKGPGVVVGRKGTLGTVHWVESDFWPHDTTLFVKSFNGNSPRFVFYFLKHMHLERYDVGAANPTLNRNHVHPLPTSWPDRETQNRIVSFLDYQTARADQIKRLAAHEIEKLSEYRQAVIAAAVMGKIDVTKEVA